MKPQKLRSLLVGLGMRVSKPFIQLLFLLLLTVHRQTKRRNPRRKRLKAQNAVIVNAKTRLLVNLETKKTETTEIGAQDIAKTEEQEDAKTEEQEDAKTEEKEETSAGKEKKYILPYALYNLGPTVLRILGYMPNGEGDEDFFVKPSRDELIYDNRSKEEDLNIFMSKVTGDHKRK